MNDGKGFCTFLFNCIDQKFPKIWGVFTSGYSYIFAKITVSTLTWPQRIWGLSAQIQGFRVVFKDNKFGREPPKYRSVRTGKVSPGSKVCIRILSGTSYHSSLNYSGSWNKNEHLLPASVPKQQRFIFKNSVEEAT